MGTSTWAIRVPDDVTDGWEYLGTRTAIGDLLPMGCREEIVKQLEKALAERGYSALWDGSGDDTLAEGIGWFMTFDEFEGEVRLLSVAKPYQLIHEVIDSVGRTKGWQLFDAGSGTRIFPADKSLP